MFAVPVMRALLLLFLSWGHCYYFSCHGDMAPLMRKHCSTVHRDTVLTAPVMGEHPSSVTNMYMT